jgi:hypothetical protein
MTDGSDYGKHLTLYTKDTITSFYWGYETNSKCWWCYSQPNLSNITELGFFYSLLSFLNRKK